MITTIIWIVVLGIVFYLIERFIPMNNIFRIVFRIVAVFIAIALLLSLLGVVAVPVKLR